MKAIYKVSHNVEKLLPVGKYTHSRYFASIDGAKQMFNFIRAKVDFSNDEFVALDSVELEMRELDEISHKCVIPLAYWSDDTKCGSEYYETA